MFKFSTRSLKRMEGVHPDLVTVAQLALELSDVDFGVSEGLRSREKQRLMVKQGKSTTMNSRHLTGHAIDVYAWVDGKVSWEWAEYKKIAKAFKKAAKKLKVDIDWGGDWKSFPDGPHFQLSWDYVPDKS
jgi:peptidoglycan L-alanyl-D-glutamate endopeptidase CwlK